MLPASTGIAQGFAVAVAVLSVGGSVHTQNVLPAVYGLLYTACFALAVRGQSSPLQLALVFAMVGLSFALHLVFLPAGATAHTICANGCWLPLSPSLTGLLLDRPPNSIAPAGLCCFFSLMIAKNDVLMGIGRGDDKGAKAA